MIKKLLYKNMPKSYQNQINNLSKYSTDLQAIYKIDPTILFIIYLSQNEIIGYLAYKDFDISYDIYNIVIDPQYQRQQIGQQLLSNIFDKKIVLEVKEGNQGAINFYQKNNFKIVNIKPKYYKDGQNAIVMVRN
ncbi:MAG: GNAT family N-acetyltransferase [Mycoplasmatales bacterium]